MTICSLCEKEDAIHMGALGDVFCNECAIDCPRCKREVSELVDGYCHLCHWEEQWRYAEWYAATIDLRGATMVYYEKGHIVMEKDGELFSTDYEENIVFSLVLDEEWEEE